jgi:hypothetical protein
VFLWRKNKWTRLCSYCGDYTSNSEPKYIGGNDAKTVSIKEGFIRFFREIGKTDKKRGFQLQER